jgi:hypothetical protein
VAVLCVNERRRITIFYHIENDTELTKREILQGTERDKQTCETRRPSSSRKSSLWLRAGEETFFRCVTIKALLRLVEDGGRSVGKRKDPLHHLVILLNNGPEADKKIKIV